MAVMKTLVLCWICLFVSVFRPAASEEQKIAAGQNVNLTCRVSNKNPIIVVEWSRTDLGSEYVLLYRGRHFDPTQQHPSFKNRVDLQDRQMKDGDVSLILKDVTVNDTGTYECRVFMRGTNRRKRALLNTDPISTIYLSVVGPPGQTRALTEDGGEEDGVSRGPLGLIVCLSVPAVLLVVVVVGLLIYRKHKQSQGSYHHLSKVPPVFSAEL